MERQPKGTDKMPTKNSSKRELTHRLSPAEAGSMPSDRLVRIATNAGATILREEADLSDHPGELAEKIADQTGVPFEIAAFVTLGGLSPDDNNPNA